MLFCFRNTCMFLLDRLTFYIFCLVLQLTDNLWQFLSFIHTALNAREEILLTDILKSAAVNRKKAELCLNNLDVAAKSY